MDATADQSLFVIASRAGMQSDEINNCLQVKSLNIIFNKVIRTNLICPKNELI